MSDDIQDALSRAAARPSPASGGGAGEEGAVSTQAFLLDGEEIPFQPGQTVIQAALAAGSYIPHLCYHPEFKPHGSCKVCTVKVNGRTAASCTLPAQAGLQVESNIDEINDLRRTLVQMLFAEGNHFCPSCEKSGNCTLQALGYDLGVMTAGFRHFFPDRPVDASHPDILLDFNRCILCELCVRASCEVDDKCVFALSGRGLTKHLVVNAESGLLADTDIALTDKAMEVCPVGVILKKRVGFAQPIGQRRYDPEPISAQALRDAPRPPAGAGHCASCEVEE
jgi:[NiFe] hydrogenase diaphorase moiety small subunit